MDDYIWCIVSGNEIIPLGHGKDLDYAMSLQHAGYGDGERKLYRLIPVVPEVLGDNAGMDEQIKIDKRLDDEQIDSSVQGNSNE